MKMVVFTNDAPWVLEAKEELKKNGWFEAEIHTTSSRSEVRRAVYRAFGGHRIELAWEPVQPATKESAQGTEKIAHLTVGERIRTSVVGSKALGQAAVEPKQVRKAGGSVPGGFDFMRTCPVCGKTLSESAFAWRDRGHSMRQSYCKRCNRLYQKGRARFLKAHNAERLVDEFTEGRRNCVNPYFQAWVKDHLD